MGMLECLKHGPQGLIEVCCHLLQGLPAGFPAAVQKLPTLWLCPVCYERAAMQRFEGLDLDNIKEEEVEAFGGAYDTIDRACCCSECLREAEYYTAKNAGQPLPFVGYERTLDWCSLPVIEALELLMREKYTFQPSRYPHSGGSDALAVLPGSFTEPLTISMYYVTALSEQDYLLSLIDDFFLNSKYPQRKVEFFEVERWHEETRGNTHSYQYLEGLLLREVLVV